MSEVFFIGDTHFGHRGILNFTKTKPFRPFATIEEHDAELIRRWNSVVSKKDVVWHLGDFCFGKRNLQIAGELNGDKRLILGNHDMYASEDYLKYFRKVCGVVEYKGMILSHIPVHECQFPRFYMNIHGHLHTEKVMKWKNIVIKHADDDSTGETIEAPDHRYFNVSCEQINLTPIPFDEILNQWAENN